MAVVRFAENGRFSVPTKDVFLIFGSYNQQITSRKLRSIESSIFVWSVLLI